jgi:DNA-binding response OmpR family regulator
LRVAVRTSSDNRDIILMSQVGSPSGAAVIKVLLIEDEDGIAEAIKRGLEKARYLVDVAVSGRAGLALALNDAYSLIILDVMLPDLDGCSVCERLRRARCAAPVLMLTARDAVPDRVRGLESGADDYLVKPFDFSELLARVRALIRRDKVHRVRLVEIGDLTIDTAARSVVRAGRQILLSPREYALLEALALAEGRVLTRELLQDTVWAGESVYPNTVDVCVGHLRRKMDTNFPMKLVRTIHGVGYSLMVGSE